MTIKKWAAAAAGAALTLSLPVTLAQATETRTAAGPHIVPTGVPVSASRPAAGPAPDDEAELLILSNEEYARRFGNRTPPTAGVPVPAGALSPAAPVLQDRDPQQPWHRINWSLRDWDVNNL
ncbi:hypothetical protein OG730_00820 [Streptomyces sp. NBC_01298]|uniref:hypothetical protein n=1 Tax=Streptomyces sp. NBC_01298 TaxID=2903817 RepID=UPI002E131B09|nr:hypothetical protein OG730_00820 [Streptomyces sp. NBC_01298]